MPNLLDELNATTLKTIYPKVIFDLAFKRKSPLLQRLRDEATPFGGGAFIQNTFLYGKTQGGSFAKGQTFPMITQQILDVTKFDIRYYFQNDVQFLEDIRVENKGTPAVFSVIKAHQEAMMLSMNEVLSVAVYRHGQASGGAVVDDRSKDINGLSEALNNGTDNSWDGNVFTTYGKNTRGSTIGTALNSTPYFGGAPDGSAGSVTYSVLLFLYLNACGGDWHPTLIVGNKAIYEYALERIQPQQRFSQEAVPKWGFDGFNFMGAQFMRDEYCPSARFGVNDARTGSNLTSTFTSASSPTSGSNLPGATTITVGETLWLLNPMTFGMRISNDPLYQFGWTGYKEAQNSTIVAGQQLVALNFPVQVPWANQQAYGFNS